MERMEDKNFDQAIQQKVEGFQPKVPAQVWDKIEAELDNGENVRAIKERKISTFPWKRMAAALVVLTSGVWWYARQPEEVVYLHGKPKTAELALSASPQSVEREEEIAKTRPKEMEQKTIQLAVDKKPKQFRRVEEGPRQMVLTSSLDHPASQPVPGRTVLKEEVYHPMVETLEMESNKLSLVQQSVIPLAQASGETVRRKKELGVSDLLNYMVGAVDKENKKIVRFSHDEEGTLSVAVDLAAVKIKL